MDAEAAPASGRRTLLTGQSLMDELRAATGATRTTLRAAGAKGDFAVIAESVVEGARSVRDDQTLDPRSGATFRYLIENHGLLIQDDAATHEYAAPRELREHYGMRSQMLGPIKRDGELIGIVSVHHGPEPRKWRDADIAALEHAVARAAAIVERPA
jgi:GAF domain-containing protein